MNAQILTIELTQDDRSISFNATADKALTTSRIAGTMANEIDLFMNLLKKSGAKGGFKFNKPFSVVFKADKEVLLDTDKIGLSVEMRERIKLNNADKAKKRFASYMYATLQWAREAGKMVEFDEFMGRISAQITTNEQRKLAEKAMEQTA